MTLAAVPAEPQVWLMVNDVPAGPFTRTDVHAKLAAGEVTWQTPACRLGTSSWLPLERVTEIDSPPAAPSSDASKPTGPEPAGNARFQSALQIGYTFAVAVLGASVVYAENSRSNGPVGRVFMAVLAGPILGLIFGRIPGAIIGGSALGWQVAILTPLIGGVVGLCLGPPVALPAIGIGIVVGLWAGAVAKLVQAGARWWVAKWPGRPRSPSAPLAAGTKRFGTWPVAGAIAACLGAPFLAGYYVENSRRMSDLPAGYQPYFRFGKLAPTGNASLDYWIQLNFDLRNCALAGSDEYFTPSHLRFLEKEIRQLPVTDVGPDLAAWAGRAADLLQARAAATPRDADAPDQQTYRWKRDLDRVTREGQTMRDDLSRRHGREFPPCLLGPPEIKPTEN